MAFVLRSAAWPSSNGNSDLVLHVSDLPLLLLAYSTPLTSDSNMASGTFPHFGSQSAPELSELTNTHADHPVFVFSRREQTFPQ